MGDWVLRIRSRRPVGEEAGALLRESGCLGIWERDPRSWEAFFPSPVEGLAQRLSALPEKLEATWEERVPVDWAARYQASLRPLPLGRRLVVLPSPDSPNPFPGRLALRLEPGCAFGTGEHYTTASCLRVLEERLQEGTAVLDVGCGSGILAVAARLLGAAEAVGCDVDPEAVRVARETARRNGVALRLFAGGAEAVRGRFGLVVANILAETLSEILPCLREKLAPGGVLVLSGILLEKGPSLLAGAEALGLLLQERRTDGIWWTFTLTLPPP
ncbi:MAG: 50S ribosomal protein L11 methyltransferase [Acidobacteriota bacterium]